MIDKAELINHIAARAGALFNGDKSQTREDIEKNIKAVVSSTLSKLELVTRDEFDTQVSVLKHTRERLEALEKEIEIFRQKETFQITPDQSEPPPSGDQP